MGRLLLLLFALFTLSISAQEPVDKVLYRVTYKTLAVKDTTARDSMGAYKYKDDDMRLDIGEKVSKFYSGRQTAYDKWIKDKVEKQDFDLSKGMPPTPNISWAVYRNYPEGETSCLDKVFINHYRVSEKTATPEWTIGNDTCTILGYHCTKAETDFKGRHWTAWYTEDIPLDNGPWKLIGLPGLILKAEDATRQFSFTAEGLEQIDGKEDLTLIKDYKKFEPVSQKEFDKVSRSSSAYDLLAAQGIKLDAPDNNVKVITNDPNKHSDHMKALKKVSPYNPIEIAE